MVYTLLTEDWDRPAAPSIAAWFGHVGDFYILQAEPDIFIYEL